MTALSRRDYADSPARSGGPAPAHRATTGTKRADKAYLDHTARQADTGRPITRIATFTILVWLHAVLLLPGVVLMILFEAPLGLPFPLSIHVALALGVPVLASLGSWRIAGRSPALNRFTLLVITLAVGLEILTTLQALAMQALLRGVGGEPPAPVFLFLATYSHPIVLLSAILTLVFAIHHGRACLEQARAGDDRAALQTGIQLYGFHRLVFGDCLVLASGNAWLAAAIPLACLAGTAIACRDHSPSAAGLRATAPTPRPRPRPAQPSRGHPGRRHLTRCRTSLDRLVALLPERHPGDLSWPTLYGLVVLAILAGDLASRLGWGLAVLPVIPITFLLSRHLRRDPIAGFAVAAGLLGGIATASPPPPPAIYHGAQLSGSTTLPHRPAGAMPA